MNARNHQNTYCVIFNAIQKIQKLVLLRARRTAALLIFLRFDCFGDAVCTCHVVCTCAHLRIDLVCDGLALCAVFLFEYCIYSNTNID